MASTLRHLEKKKKAQQRKCSTRDRSQYILVGYSGIRPHIEVDRNQSRERRRTAMVEAAIEYNITSLGMVNFSSRYVSGLQDSDNSKDLQDADRSPSR